MTNYTSPFTGKVYQVSPNTLWRAAWDENGPYKKWYTVYTFYHEGAEVLKTFSLDESTLNATFGEYEGAYASWLTSARD